MHRHRITKPIVRGKHCKFRSVVPFGIRIMCPVEPRLSIWYTLHLASVIWDPANPTLFFKVRLTTLFNFSFHIGIDDRLHRHFYG